MAENLTRYVSSMNKYSADRYVVKIYNNNGEIVDLYSASSEENIRKWFLDNWYWQWENGKCLFEVYKNENRLSFNEINNILMYDHPYYCYVNSRVDIYKR